MIIRNGNVALDVARMLAVDDERIGPTDVDAEYEEYRKKRRIKNVVLLGRRGMIQTSFTTKELREMTKLKGVSCYLVEEEFQRSMNEISMIECSESGEGVQIHKVKEI